MLVVVIIKGMWCSCLLHNKQTMTAIFLEYQIFLISVNINELIGVYIYSK